MATIHKEDKQAQGDRFTWKDGDLVLPQCLLCKHYDTQAKQALCTAFPRGIPTEILANEADHRRILAGEPFHFEPRANASDASLKTLYRFLDNLA